MNVLSKKYLFLATALTSFYSFAASSSSLPDDGDEDRRPTRKHQRTSEKTQEKRKKKQRITTVSDTLSPEEHYQAAEKLYHKNGYAVAETHLIKAAAQNHAGALARLGWLYYHKPGGGNRDFNKASDYFDRAIALGSLDAKYWKALMHEIVGKNKKSPYYNQVNNAVTLKWFRELADANHPATLFTLGKSNEKDENVAMNYYIRAAEFGSSDALEKILGFVLNGKAVKGNVNRLLNMFNGHIRQEEELHKDKGGDLSKIIRYKYVLINSARLLSNKSTKERVEAAVLEETFSIIRQYLEANVYVDQSNFKNEFRRDLDPCIYTLIKLLADQNDAEALYYLARAYHKHRHLMPEGEKDIESLVKYYKQSFQLGFFLAARDLEMFHNYGTIQLEGSLESRWASIKEKADGGNSQAQFAYGCVCYKYFNLKEEGVAYFELSAQQKNPQAKQMLGSYFETRDIEKAIEYYCSAYNLGDKSVAHALAKLLEKNPETAKEALTLYKVGSNSGSQASRFDWARMVLDGPIKNEIGFAVQSLIVDASNGHIDSIVKLAEYYQKKEDNKYASIYLIKAAECFEKRDVGKAIEYYRSAYNLGDKTIAHALAKLLEKNPETAAEALALYRVGADSGSQASRFDWARMILDGQLEKDKDFAVQSLIVDANKGHVASMVKLAEYYQKIEDNKNAMIYLKKAADKGHAKSSHEFGVLNYKIAVQKLDSNKMNKANQRLNIAVAYLNFSVRKKHEESIPFFEKASIDYIDLLLRSCDFSSSYILLQRLISLSPEANEKFGIVERMKDVLKRVMPENLSNSYNFELFQEYGYRESLATLATGLYAEHKAALMEYWVNNLNSDNQDVSRGFAIFIHYNLIPLGFMQDDEIAQQAVAILSITQDVAKNKKNPFRVMKDLREKHNEAVDWNSIAPTHDISGKEGRFIPQAFADLGVERIIDPASIPVVTFEQLRDSLLIIEEKIKDDARLDERIKKDLTGGELSFSDLKKLVLGNNGFSYLSNLLRSNSEDSYYFKCVLNAAFSVPSVGSSSASLTSVEEQLIRALMGLRNCETGQGGSVKDYYLHYVPNDYKLRYLAGSAVVGETPEVQKAKEALTDIIKDIFEAFLNRETAFQRRLCGLSALMDDTPQSKTKQLSHQVKYLRNLIGPKIGVSKKLEMDRGSGSLYDAILTHTTQDALRVFYEEMSADNFFMRELMIKINEAIRADSTGVYYQTLQAVVNLNKNIAPGWLEPKLDDDGNIISPPQINLEGVFDLLVKMGLAEKMSELRTD